MPSTMVRNWINPKSGAIDVIASDTSLSSVEVVSQTIKVVSQITSIKSIIHLNTEENKLEKHHSHVITVISKAIVLQIVGRKREI